ncbi:MerR family transcriptional regulator [Agrococcus sp. Marseille-Q4369]|uniref:heat shock protein transcriptional repressor HspR n=1 Tax=Agrococcus sp. Marseille-Q4369 TaxID=2810513 RepID=UPI001B8B6D33|nr:MerR family transcriptional regulator [Agrococcus sp. Marseille-Q4369]QUW18155.1 MerR family transcriptional regulator [Agrococcus sp. Marseille-Q4369]
MRAAPSGLDETSPIFSIAAAAELAGLHAQTLRQYDRLGLVEPARTARNTRRYSMRDVGRLKQVQLLSSEGVSLEGIRRILAMSDENRELRARVRELEAALADAVMQQQGRRVFAAGSAGITTLRAGARPSKPGSVVLWGTQPRD